MNKENDRHDLKRKYLVKEWSKTALEIGKWALVVWLLWPLGRPVGGNLTVARVVTGVCLFVIFAGKVFYDVIIMDIIRQRRTSVRQDIVTLIAAVTIIALLVGLVLALLGLFIMKWAQASGSPVS